MNRLLTTILLTFIFSTVILYGQDLPEERRQRIEEKRRRTEEKKEEQEKKRKTRRAVGDTTRARPGAEPAEEDTVKRQPVTSKIYWYNLENGLSEKSDTSHFEIFRSTDEKQLIYTDMSDIFRNQPLWFNFDLQENGRPTYLGMINTYPHQTPFYFGSVLMNNPIHGQFNMQFIPLNFIRYAERDYTSGSINNYGYGSGAKVNITPNSVHTEQPWTRILFKQGGYGHSDLDVSFELPFTGDFAVQLGGTRRLFDGSTIESPFDGENYRAEVTWQYSPDLYIRGQMFLNRKEVGLTSFDINHKIDFPKNEESEDNFFLDITWVTDDSTGQRLHTQLYYTFYARKFTNNFTTYTLETKSKRTGIDANYNFFLGDNELLVGGGAILPQVLGNPFPDNPYLTSLNAYGTINIPFADRFMFRAGSQVTYMKDFDPQIMPSLGLDIDLSKNQRITFDLTQGHRFPNATERFFNFDTLYGNQNLIPEGYMTFHSQYRYNISDAWRFRLDAGYHRINNEIVWEDSVFNNGMSRDFIFFGLESSTKIWKIDVSLGGQYTLSDVHLTPRSSAWGQAHFHDVFLKGALIFDAYGTAYFYDKRQLINYHPRLDRFYMGQRVADAAIIFNWKLVATLQSAAIFFEMDNALSEQYEFINGFPNYFRRLRFGINWVMWN